MQWWQQHGWMDAVVEKAHSYARWQQGKIVGHQHAYYGHVSLTAEFNSVAAPGDAIDIISIPSHISINSVATTEWLTDLLPQLFNNSFNCLPLIGNPNITSELPVFFHDGIFHQPNWLAVTHLQFWLDTCPTTAQYGTKTAYSPTRYLNEALVTVLFRNRFWSVNVCPR